MATFDRTFDRTFRGVTVPQTAVAPANTCGGMTLMWLTGAGWHYWTFEAYRDTLTNTASVGTYQRKGLSVSTQKVTKPRYTLRTADLSEGDSQHVAGLLSSIAVYWLRDVDGQFGPTPVIVETADMQVWKDSLSRTDHEITIALPLTYSLRR